MLTKIILTNFRSHEHTTIDLCSGINVFVGRGQAGKTNIKRALEWLCFNKPSGDKVHSKWCKNGDFTEVSVITDDGYTVTIHKDVREGVEYYLTTPDNKVESFRKVGGKVPDRIEQVLRLQDINIQGQLDQPFLVTDSTGEISKQVNEIIDLEIADKWLKELNSKKRTNNEAIKTLEKHSAEADGILKAFGKLDRIGLLLDKAEAIQDSIDSAEQKLEAIDSCINSARSAENRIKQASKVLEVMPLLDKADKLYESIQADKDALRVLDRLSAIAKNVDRYSDECSQAIGNYADLLKEIGVCPFCLKPLSDEDQRKLLTITM